jgi:putative NADH-flavin reductase
MKIALIGATGNAGSRLLKEAVSRGHTVTAIARHTEKVPKESSVTAKAADLNDTKGLADALRGHDVVISSVRFVAAPAHALIDAVKQSGVKRLLVVGGAGSLEVAPGKALIDTPQFPEAAKPEAGAGRASLEALRKESALDWTFLSPSALFTGGERTGKFRLGDDQLLTGADGKSWISFEDYAIAMIDELENPKHSRKRFTVGY